jgi:FkbM family methyltransferase
MRPLEPLKFILKSVLPARMFLKILTWKRGFPEPELELIKNLCDKNKISIDVGAAEGLYIARMYFNSKKCIAFEPRPDAARDLARLTTGLTPPVDIENVALSDFSGETELRVYANEVGRSTIEKSNIVEDDEVIESITVPVKKLDEYNFEESVGFIKIDVEGHEGAVLRGAKKLLSKDHPVILIEVEERHKKNSVNDVTLFLERLGYKGFYLKDGLLISIENFDLEVHQNLMHLFRKGEYINNFIYLTNTHSLLIQRS